MSDTVFNAITQLGYARDDLLEFYHAKTPTRLIMAVEALGIAASKLGYTLTPITEDPHVATQPQSQLDSGRLNLREESPAQFEPHQAGGA